MPQQANYLQLGTSIAPENIVVKYEAIDQKKASYMKIVGHIYDFEDQVYIDTDFQLPELKGYKKMRLLEIYHSGISLFSELPKMPVSTIERNAPITVHQLDFLDMSHINVLLQRKKIEQNGYYELLIKKKGLYHSMHVDDIVYINEKGTHTLWGISLRQPWKVLLLKAWMKATGGLSKVKDVKPFELLNAFGYYGYKVLSPKKELQFIENNLYLVEKGSQESFQEKMKNLIKLDRKSGQENSKMIGLTGSIAQFYGLIPYCLGYKVRRCPTSVKPFYIGTAQSATEWNGTIKREKAIDIVGQAIGLNQFVMSEEEFKTIFNRIYMAPLNYFSDSKFTMHTFVESERLDRASYISLHVKTTGLAVINIQAVQTLSQSQTKQNKPVYPQIQLLMGTFNDRDLPNVSVAQSTLQVSQSNVSTSQQKDSNVDSYLPPSHDWYNFFDAHYQNGVSNTLTKFLRLSPGLYVLRIRVKQEKAIIPFNIAITTNAIIENNTFTSEAINKTISSIERPSNTFQSKNDEVKLFLQSCLAKYTLQNCQIIKCLTENVLTTSENGISTSQKRTRDHCRINICPSFSQIGFGTILVVCPPSIKESCIVSLSKTLLKQGGFRLSHIYDKLQSSFTNLNELSTTQQDINILNFKLEPGQAIIFVTRLIDQNSMKYPFTFPPNNTLQITMKANK